MLLLYISKITLEEDVLGANVSSLICVESTKFPPVKRGAHVTKFGLYFVELNGEKSMSVCNLGSSTLKPWQEGLMNK